MLEKIKQLAGESFIYGLSSVLTRFVTLLLIPIYTAVLSPSDYGALNLVNITFFLIGTIVVFGLDNSVAVWFWEKEDVDDRKTTFSSWFWFQTLVSIMVSLPLCLFAAQASNLILQDNGGNKLLIVLSAINLPFILSHRVLINWYRMHRRALSTVIFTLLINFLTIGLTVLFIIQLKLGVSGVLWAQAISSIVGFAVVVIKLYPWLRINFFDKIRLLDMLKFGLPLVPSALSFWLLSSSGSYFIQRFAGASEVGLYQIALTFAGILNLIVMAFNQAWPPFAFSIVKDDNHKKIFSLIYDLFFFVGILGAAALWVFSSDLLTVFTTPDYYDSKRTLGILALNVFVGGITSVTAIGCNIAKTNMPYLRGVIIASLGSIILYMLLIPQMGKEGAAIGTLIGNIILSIYVTIAAERLYPVGYNLTKSLMYMFSFLLFVFIFEYTLSTGGFYKRMLFFVVYVAGVCVFNKGLIIAFKNMITRRA